MKRTIGILAAILIIVAFVTCKKQNYCAECVEQNSGYHAANYCGTEEEVDAYIKEIYELQVITGQRWYCKKVIE